MLDLMPLRLEVRKKLSSRSDRVKAVDIGNSLLQVGLMHHVTHDHTFKDKGLFYAVRVPSEALVAAQPRLAAGGGGHGHGNGVPRI